MIVRNVVAALFVPACLIAFARNARAQDENDDEAPPATSSAPASTPAPAEHEYTAPLYQRTQPSYVPQSVALSGPHQLNDWNEGEPIPPGYHPVERTRRGLIIGGAVTFGSLYLISLFAAAAGADSTDPGEKNQEAALWIPVAGPFIQMANTSTATGNLFLAIDGIAQTAGVGMFIAGLAWPSKVLIRNDLAGKNKLNLSFTPVISKSMSGWGLTGTF
jgi:hypothetical protein